jgi:HAD superfamily hydrolase (TIGR01509 family)
MSTMPLLLLDLDNTVADRDAAFAYWMQVSLSEWAPGDQAARKFLEDHDDDGTRPRVEFLADVRERFARPEPVEELLVEYRRLTLAGFPPMNDEAKQQLQSMRESGWKIAVVSNGDSGVQEATAERVGLSPLLDACVVSGTVGIRKPDPRIFEIAAQQCGQPVRGAWMIGDSEADILGADRAGMHSVWLARNREWNRHDVFPDVIAAGLIEAIHVVADDRMA